MQPETLIEPQLIIDDLWQRLARAVVDRRQAFRTPCLVTVDAAGLPQGRTVVLREADRGARVLMCHTDRRSAKLREIEMQARIVWVFYDARTKLQLRMSGITTLHADDAIAESRWAASQPMARECYRNDRAPGTVLDGPDAWTRDAPDGRAHFAVVRTVVESIDWLYLRAANHRRLMVTYSAGGDWSAAWVQP